MKKFLLFTLVFCLLSVNNANANEGFYVGGNVSVSKSKIKDKGSQVAQNIKSTKPIVALDLGYKFNFGGFTVAPELYVNLLGKVVKKTKHNEGVADKYKQTEVGGLNIKLGYDISEELNTFVLVGLSYMGKIKNSWSGGEDAEPGKLNLKMKKPVYNVGVGAEYEVVDNLGVNFTVVYSAGKSKKHTEEEGYTQYKYKDLKFALGANYYLGF